MTTRTDIDMDFNQSPRVIVVREPSTEFLVQDVHDTLVKQEDDWRGQSEKRLIRSAGKENLGAGRQVGITSTMQDTLAAFATRRTPAETGTVTSVPASPIAGRQRFADSAADFTAAGVVRGSLVVNFSDQSIADVTTVINSTTLETLTLVNGIGNTYDVTDIYQVFNVVQCNAGGGNLLAIDSVGADIFPILPTAFTQVIVERDSSAVIVNADAATFWDALTADHETVGSFGEKIGKKLLTIATFLGLK